LDYEWDEVATLLQDEESRIYLKARYSYHVEKSLASFYRIIRELNNRYEVRDLECFLQGRSISGWIVYGSDDIAEYNFLILKDLGFSVQRLCVEEEPKEKLYDKDYISLSRCEYLLKNEKYALLISSEGGYEPNQMDMFQNLPNNQILNVRNQLVGRYGWQYFDLFTPQKNEIFLDGGSMDGATVKGFIKWCHGEYKEIYAFEPNPHMVSICQKNLENYSEKKAYFFPCALWKQEDVLRFHATEDSKWDARISSDGSKTVLATSIDLALPEVAFTFIKLDVEGCELEVLEGAEKCIRSFRPKLAVSVYHNSKDILHISKYLLSLIPDYRLYIRHYHTDHIETILYAV